MPDDHAARRGSEADRGREAERPQDLPARGWKDTLKRAWGEVSENNLFLIAGGVTYAVLLALFPGLAALVSIYGLVLDPSQIEKQLDALSGVLPEQTVQLIGAQLHQLVSASSGALGLGAVLGLLLALWSARSGMSGLISAINIAYEQKETRGFFKFNLIALGFTIGAILSGLVVIALIAGLPAIVGFIGFGSIAKWIILILEWPLLVVLMMVALAILYRVAPDRKEPQWRWVSPGAIAATILWILASLAFTIYVANFNSYDKTYGSLGGVVILMTWLYITFFVVLLGAAMNAQAERQTRRDTTPGKPKQLGKRGAYAADTVGESTG